MLRNVKAGAIENTFVLKCFASIVEELFFFFSQHSLLLSNDAFIM